MDTYSVKPLRSRDIEVSVPASKSILSRALLLAAFCGGKVFLHCGPYPQDTRDLIGCFTRLGVRITPEDGGLLADGTHIEKSAVLDVGSAGTAARFLTAMLAFRGGDYSFTASRQMSARPMDHLFALEEAGVAIEYGGEYGRFPFRMHSDGITAPIMQLGTDTSTQYASGVLLAAACGNAPFTLRLSGERADGSYIRMTLAVLKAFGADYVRGRDGITVIPSKTPPKEYFVEPDVSGACYFYALALLCGARVRVRGVHLDSLQGDVKFLSLLGEKGVIFTESAEGLTADGRHIRKFTGFDVDMRDFSDQALTLAAIAPFAETPTVIRGIGHIRRQECDRIEAIRCNLHALGVPCEADADSVKIYPAPVRGGTVRTFNDHRVAMAFSLIGARAGGVVIENPQCCEKSFGNFFTLLGGL